MVQAHKLKFPKISDQQSRVLRTLQQHPDMHIVITRDGGWYASSVIDTARRAYMPSVRRLLKLHYLQREGTIVTLTELGRSYGT